MFLCWEFTKVILQSNNWFKIFVFIIYVQKNMNGQKLRNNLHVKNSMIVFWSYWCTRLNFLVSFTLCCKLFKAFIYRLLRKDRKERGRREKGRGRLKWLESRSWRRCARRLRWDFRQGCQYNIYNLLRFRTGLPMQYLIILNRGGTVVNTKNNFKTLVGCQILQFFIIYRPSNKYEV